MRIMNLIINFINKDVHEANESKRIMVTLRVLCLIVISAFVADTFFAGLGIIAAYPGTFISFYLAFVIFFISTYYFRTKLVLRFFIFLIYFWVFLMTPAFGWSAGMQNYCIIILMLLFFASFSRSEVKFAYSFVVLLFRFVLIAVFGGVMPPVRIAGYIDKGMQITNITAVFVSIIFISYVFSKNEIEAEDKLMKYNDRLRKEANTDQLTGLYNRRRAVEYLKELTSSIYMENNSIAIGDIDFFKRVNDTYGHDIGDEVLKFLAKEMMETCGDEAFIARWGGEEFIIVFPGLNGDEAYVRLEALHNKIQNTPVIACDIKIDMTMTFGLSELPYGNDAGVAIKEADEKLYMGKSNGRNQVVY